MKIIIVVSYQQTNLYVIYIRSHDNQYIVSE